MIAAAGARSRLRFNLSGWAVACAGCVALVGRHEISSPQGLALFYLGLFAVTATRRETVESARANTVAVLVIGLLAVLAAAASAGRSVPLRGDAIALTLNVFAAVAEESLFRKVLYARLVERGAVLAITASAAIFALVHLSAYGAAVLPVDFGAGLLLGWQRWASGNWRVPAVTHVFANVLATL